MTRRWRKVPKTTGVTATGTCGHGYQRRIALPRYMSGKVADAAAVAEADHFIQGTCEALRSQPCPDCMAALTLTGIRGALRTLAEVLDRPVPPPLIGTTRQVAFAEGVRSDRFWSAVTARVSLTMDMVGRKSAADDLLTHVLRARFPEVVSVAHVPEDIEQLAEQMRSATRSVMYLHRNTREAVCWLAVWLVLRAEWDADWAVFHHSNTRGWITKRRAKDYETPLVLSSLATSVQAAVLTVRIGGWRTREEAAAMFATLMREESLLGNLLTTAGPQESLNDLMEQTSVMDALTGPARPTGMPF